MPLAQMEEPGDDQDLKGWALNANWPMHMSSSEVLALLTWQNDNLYLGGYSSFLHRFATELGTEITDSGAPICVGLGSQISSLRTLIGSEWSPAPRSINMQHHTRQDQPNELFLQAVSC